MKSLLLNLLILLSASQVFGQAVSQALSSQTEIANVDGVPTLGCGSHHLMQHADKAAPGYLQQSNQLLEQVAKIINQGDASYKKNDIITIPVVFHIVHNDAGENLDDSVILNQLDILNKAFGHSHDDTGAVRDIFKSRVGDAQIEFELAKVDPDGNKTTGIVRKATNIKQFGGVLPYAQGQQAQILQWINDSFYTNLFRITHSDQGGSDEWNPYGYLNIWIGDLRIFEPKVNNAEELLFLALATNPMGHENWPAEVLPKSIKSQGVLMHYITVGSNNPNDFPAPYGAYNTVIKQGKTAVHEIGHYLGLRHIWGDVNDCETDDYIDDTPICRTQSNFQCSAIKNTCRGDTDDEPDMIENYMDYSSGDCQIAFTRNQIEVMRAVYWKYRSPSASVSNPEENALISVFPNPSQGNISIISSFQEPLKITIRDISGRMILETLFSGSDQLNLQQAPGVYFIEASSNGKRQIQKLIVQ